MEKSQITFTREDTKVVKAVAIILMLIHHLFYFPERYIDGVSYVSLFSYDGNTIEYQVGMFGKICVMIFIFLGGYGTYIVCKNKSNSEITSILSNKCKKLYFVYWQVFLIFIPICMYVGVECVSTNIDDIIWNFSGLKITYNGEWWFFTPFLFLVISFPLLLNIIKKIKSPFSEFILICLVNTVVVFLVPTITEYYWAKPLENSYVYSILCQTLRLLSGFWMGCFCAKYDLLSKMKRKFSGNVLWSFLGLLCIVLTFFMRNKTSPDYDFLYAPIFSISIIAALNNFVGKFIRKALMPIGKEATIMWLTHSFYCYLLCQKFIFMPKYSLLILLWLILISFATAKVIRAFYKGLNVGYLKIKQKLMKE